MTKITISPPDEVLRDIDGVRGARGETRSEFVRGAVVDFLRIERERRAVEQYVRGYQELPETIEDTGGLLELGLSAMAGEPWDDDPRQTP